MAGVAGNGTRWIIDPIDGTVNFARGIQVWATLIAVERAGELLAAAVSAPALGQRWSAYRGGGATTSRGGSDVPIHVSSVSRLSDASIVHAGIGDLDRDGRAAGVRAVLDGASRDRGIGDFWGYMLVAQGSADAMFEVGVKPWDLAAPALIVAEAGGRFTDLDGTPARSGPTALATNGLLHDALLGLLGEPRPFPSGGARRRRWGRARGRPAPGRRPVASRSARGSPDGRRRRPRAR